MEENKIGIAILGSTGNLGQKVLEILEEYPNPYKIEVLSASENIDLLKEQALKFKPNVVVIKNSDLRQKVDDVLWEEDIKTYAGLDALHQVTEMKDVHVVVNAIKGMDGTKPSIMAAVAGKNLILGNTESILNTGSDVLDEISKRGTKLFSLELYQSAFFQLMRGEDIAAIKKVTMGCSINESLRLALKTIYDVKPEIVSFDESMQAMVCIQFVDGIEKSISNVDENQAIKSSLFYPLRVHNDTH